MYRDIYKKMNALSDRASSLVARFGGLPGTDIVFRPTEHFYDKEKALPFKDPMYLDNTRIKCYE